MLRAARVCMQRKGHVSKGGKVPHLCGGVVRRIAERQQHGGGAVAVVGVADEGGVGGRQPRAAGGHVLGAGGGVDEGRRPDDARHGACSRDDVTVSSAHSTV